MKTTIGNTDSLNITKNLQSQANYLCIFSSLHDMMKTIWFGKCSDQCFTQRCAINTDCLTRESKEVYFEDSRGERKKNKQKG